MRELVTEIDIQAPADTVWRILTDLDAYGDWNPFIRKAVGEVKEGAALEINLEPPGGKAMTFKPTVTHVDPAREFRWLGRLLFPGLFDGQHVFEISRSGDESVHLVHREEFRGLLVPLLWRSLDTQTRAGFEAMNEALKTRAESGGRSLQDSV